MGDAHYRKNSLGRKVSDVALILTLTPALTLPSFAELREESHFLLLLLKKKMHTATISWVCILNVYKYPELPPEAERGCDTTEPRGR